MVIAMGAGVNPERVGVGVDRAPRVVVEGPGVVVVPDPEVVRGKWTFY